MRFERQVVITSKRYVKEGDSQFSVEMIEDGKMVGGGCAKTSDEALKIASEDQMKKFLEGR